MGRKDRERFQRLREGNPNYVGYRGLDTVTVTEALPPQMETLACSVCNRKRNVANDSLPEDISTFVCLRCQEDTARSVLLTD